MSQSAFLGQPPVNERDRMIARGVTMWNSWPDVPANLTGAEGLPTVTSPNPRLFDSHCGRIYAASTVSIFLVVMITGTRVIAKLRSKHSRLGWDDWLISFAALAFVGYASITIDQVRRGGVGKREYNVTYAEIQNRAASIGVSYWLLYFVIVPTKLSVVCFNARLTGLTSTFWIWVHRTFFVLLSAFGLFYIPWYAFSMSPTSAFYNFITLATAQNPRSRHPTTKASLTASLVIHVVSDWLLLAIPIYLVLKLRMPLAKKLRCILPISIGCLSAIGATFAINSPVHFKGDTNLHQDQQIGFQTMDLVCSIIATSLPSVANVVGRQVRASLPSSLQRYFSADPESLSYESNPSNPFGSDRAGDESTSDREKGESVPDASDEKLEGGRARQWIDVKVASHRISGLWVLGSKGGSRNDVNQWPAKS